MFESSDCAAGDSSNLPLEKQRLLVESRAAEACLSGATKNHGSAIAPTMIAAMFIFIVIALQWVPYHGNRELHTVMEVVATLLAFIVGVLSLVRYYSKKNNTYLLLATGFMGTALLDGYHAVVTSDMLDYLMPSPPESLSPWSWNASRIFLAILMTMTWLASRREAKYGISGRIRESLVYTVVAGLTVASFCFFAFVPLPRAYYPEMFPEMFFGRPEEFVAAALFAIALVGYVSRADPRMGSFDTWFIWSLLVGFVCQAIVMSRSFVLFDMPFNLAHALKIVSYVLVLTGLLIEVQRLFRQAEESRVSLQALSNKLAAQTDYAS